ncbi:hypothetical protein [Pseudobacteriovorax antillogorgiicola]|uniref:Uncharacterized protein n=1 Tax=Pseudobacteriovorax antillogorgiicola TaxID=1513793 RepID=A0A1Y6BXA6_9BACT|nr:hypothetical protein [Pseudobacteriovorax antillogorgiicola]TCS53725.1 hypothetical protein EDD56_10734 [Pseudobacteriovorax antillogorgiicola]SMF22792.1 hypothetical protein SAMN06296036_107238 [Pseudobacteriovorax antillogorgiicola]
MKRQAVNARTVKDFLYSTSYLLITIIAAFSFLKSVEKQSSMEATSSDSIPVNTKSTYKRSTTLSYEVEDIYESNTPSGSAGKDQILVDEVSDVASDPSLEKLEFASLDPKSLIESGDIDGAALEILSKSHDLAKFSPIIDTNIDLERYYFLEAFVVESPKLAQNYELAFELFTIGSVNGIEGSNKYLDNLKQNHRKRLETVCTEMYLHYHSSRVKQKVESCAATMGVSVVYEYLMNIYFDGDISRYEAEYQTFMERYQLKPIQDFSEELEYVYES